MQNSEKKDDRFINPWMGRSTRKSLKDLIKWGFQGGRSKWPRRRENKYKASPVNAVEPGKAVVTFINHSTFLIQLEGINILTDPVFSKRVSPVQWAGPRRIRPAGMTFDELPEIHLILISHSHYDHMDIPALKILNDRFSPINIVGLGNEAFLRKKGIYKVVELDWGEEITVGESGQGVRILFTPAQHFAARTPFDTDTTLWGGFIIKQEEYRIYFTGDTGYAPLFKAIAREHGPFDLAMIPIGAYEPRWFMYDTHVNPEEAVQLHRDIAAKTSVAMHFGTFQLTDEGIDEPVQKLLTSLKDNNIPVETFAVMDNGETREF